MGKQERREVEEKLRSVYQGYECIMECVELLKEESVLLYQSQQSPAVVGGLEEESQELSIPFPSGILSSPSFSEMEITQSEPFTVKRSKFQGFCARVSSSGFSLFLLFSKFIWMLILLLTSKKK